MIDLESTRRRKCVALTALAGYGLLVALGCAETESSTGDGARAATSTDSQDMPAPETSEMQALPMESTVEAQPQASPRAMQPSVSPQPTTPQPAAALQAPTPPGSVSPVQASAMPAVVPTEPEPTEPMEPEPTEPEPTEPEPTEPEPTEPEPTEPEPTEPEPTEPEPIEPIEPEPLEPEPLEPEPLEPVEEGRDAVKPSAGCGQAAYQGPGKWEGQPAVQAKGRDRTWDVILPNKYDPTRAYPLVLNFHGCGDKNNNVPMEKAAGENAINVRGKSIDDKCWDEHSPETQDLEFFDNMVKTVSEKACVDENRIFATGYSSGSWLLSWLGCLRPDVIRAIGTVTGGDRVPGGYECMGPIPHMIIHDLDDQVNKLVGNQSRIERVRQLNGCEDNKVAEAPEPCEAYQGCEEGYPLKVCFTRIQGYKHGRQDDFSSNGFWRFFSQF